MSQDLAHLNLLHPQSEIIDGKEYVLSKFPAVQGREIVTKYPVSAIPRLGDYAVNEAVMLKLMSYVAVRLPGGAVRLDNINLINSHVPSFETLIKIEAKMFEYNVSFFQNGGISTLFQDLAQKAPMWISRMLTGFVDRLSQQIKPPSES